MVATAGIVLSQIKYAESSIICRIYTAELGLQSYIVNGVRKKRGKSGYFQPLSLLDLVVYHKDKGGLQRIKEVKTAYPYESIPFDILKSSVALFLAEVLNNCLKEEESNPLLFKFLFEQLCLLDTAPANGSFHLRFLLDLSGYLGFYPNKEGSSLPFFDLINACFTKQRPAHKHYLSPPISEHFAHFLEGHNLGPHKKEVLSALLDYYKIHLDDFKDIQSHAILETVLHS